MDPLSCRLCLYALNSESTSLIFNITIILLLIVFSAFLAASETAFSCCNKNRMKSKAEDGDKGAKRVVKILDNISKGIVATLIMINIAHVLTSTLATVLFIRLLGDVGTLVSTIVITILVFIFSETLPKNIAKSNADRLAIKYAPFIQFFIYILYPLVLLFSLPYKAMEKSQRENNEYDEEDLQTMVETIEEEGVLEEDESQLIQNAIEFDGIRAREIFTPLSKTTMIDINKSTKEIIDVLLEDGQYSRIPVYDKTRNNIIGVLTTKSVLNAYVSNKKISIRDFIIKPYLVKTNSVLDDILDGFLKNKTHMGFVVDSKNTILGIITLDDVLDELVEDIVVEDGDNNE